MLRIYGYGSLSQEFVSNQINPTIMALSPSCINVRVNVYYQYRLVSIVGFSVECFCTDINQTNQSMYYV